MGFLFIINVACREILKKQRKDMGIGESEIEKKKVHKLKRKPDGE